MTERELLPDAECGEEVLAGVNDTLAVGQRIPVTGLDVKKGGTVLIRT